MQLNIYFHRDFDGIVSAALLSVILKELNKFDEFKFIPVDYNIKEKWLSMSLERPAAVLDFLYHQDALYYFDHHTTSFLNDAHKKSFTEDENHCWKEIFKSTPSLLKYKFIGKFNFDKYADVIEWADIIDSAQYNSSKDIYDYSKNFIVLNKLISFYYNDDDQLLRIIDYIVLGNIKKFLEENEEIINKICNEEKSMLKCLKQRIELKGSICIFDQGDLNVDFQRFLPYYFYPNINYALSIYRKKELFSISISYNPWKRNNTINLGELAKHYNGGGRENVAGILCSSYNEAKNIVSSIHRELIGRVSRQYSHSLVSEEPEGYN